MMGKTAVYTTACPRTARRCRYTRADGLQMLVTRHASLRTRLLLDGKRIQQMTDAGEPVVTLETINDATASIQFGM